MSWISSFALSSALTLTIVIFVFVIVVIYFIIKMNYTEDIYFFEVDTKYISLSVLKTSEFSLVKILMFSTHMMKYILYLSKKK